MKNGIPFALVLLLLTACAPTSYPPGTVPTDQQLLDRIDLGEAIFQVTFDRARKLRVEAGGPEIGFDGAFYLKAVQDPRVAKSLKKYFYIQESRPVPEPFGRGALMTCVSVPQEIDGVEYVVEKGYAVLEDHADYPRDPLDTEPDGYIPGTILFRQFQGALALYYVRRAE